MKLLFNQNLSSRLIQAQLVVCFELIDSSQNQSNKPGTLYPNWILLPKIRLIGKDSISMSSKHLTLTAQPSKGRNPSLNSCGVGSLGRRKGRTPQVGQK